MTDQLSAGERPGEGATFDSAEAVPQPRQLDEVERNRRDAVIERSLRATGSTDPEKRAAEARRRIEVATRRVEKLAVDAEGAEQAARAEGS